jgi:hypothetical protein
MPWCHRVSMVYSPFSGNYLYQIQWFFLYSNPCPYIYAYFCLFFYIVSIYSLRINLNKTREIQNHIREEILEREITLHWKYVHNIIHSIYLFLVSTHTLLTYTFFSSFKSQSLHLLLKKNYTFFLFFLLKNCVFDIQFGYPIDK